MSELKLYHFSIQECWVYHNFIVVAKNNEDARKKLLDRVQYVNAKLLEMAKLVEIQDMENGLFHFSEDTFPG